MITVGVILLGLIMVSGRRNVIGLIRAAATLFVGWLLITMFS